MASLLPGSMSMSTELWTSPSFSLSQLSSTVSTMTTTTMNTFLPTPSGMPDVLSSSNVFATLGASVHLSSNSEEPVQASSFATALSQSKPERIALPEGTSSVQIVLITAFIVCMVMGNIGNILVMGAILIEKKLRSNVANVFIFNLAIADFCVTSFVDLSYVMGNVHPEVFANPILCNMAASVCIISCTCSMWSICAISINRFVCITQSKYYSLIFSRRNSMMMAAGLWVLCAFIDLPNYIGLGAHIFDDKKMGCSFDRIDHYGYSYYFVIMGVVMPLFLVLFAYTKVFIFVRESDRRLQKWRDENRQGDRPNIERVSKADRRLLMTVFLIFNVFLVCWTPYAIVVLSDVRNVYPREVYVGAIILAHFNSSINSVLYGLTNKRFRNGYTKLLRVNRWRRSCRRNAVGDFDSTAVNDSLATVSREVNGMKRKMAAPTSHVTSESGTGNV